MSHKLSELGIQHDGFICFNNPNEVVSDKEFEEIKNDLANMRKEALKMLAEKKMITIDLDTKFAIVSDGEVLNLVQKDGKFRKDGTPSGQKWWFNTYGQAIKFYEKKVDAGKPIHSLRELAKQIDSGYKRIEIMVDQKLKEAGVE